MILYLLCESVLLLVLFGLWIASGFGVADPDAVLRGHPLRPGAGPAVGVLPRGAAGAEPDASRPTGPTPDAHPGQAVAGLLPARRAGRLVHADLRADALVPPRAARGAQEHPGLGPGDRRGRSTASRPASSRPTRRPARTSRPRSPTLATGLDANDAFVIFPEGGNFTPRRRERAIDRLRKLGLERMARAGRGDDQRAGAAAGWLAGGAGRGARRRRRAGRAHRARPHGHRRRHLARAADGQAAA